MMVFIVLFYNYLTCRKWLRRSDENGILIPPRANQEVSSMGTFYFQSPASNLMRWFNHHGCSIRRRRIHNGNGRRIHIGFMNASYGTQNRRQTDQINYFFHNRHFSILRASDLNQKWVASRCNLHRTARGVFALFTARLRQRGGHARKITATQRCPMRQPAGKLGVMPRQLAA